MNHQGVIALDIDGTLTYGKRPIAGPITAYLDQKAKEGWTIFFITGRTLAFATMAISHLKFPYYIGVQNGADILEMPAKKNVFRKHIPLSILDLFDQIFDPIEGDYLVHTDYEKGDVCHYREKHLTKEGLEYIKRVGEVIPVKSVESFKVLDGEHTPYVKCFGTHQEMIEMEKLLEMVPGISCVRNRDVIVSDRSILLISAEGIDKGTAVSHLLETKIGQRPVIAAGDDRNDIPLLKVADVGIAIENGCQELIEMADIVAKGPEEHGVIAALDEGIAKCL